jgi:hypothetical protein
MRIYAFPGVVWVFKSFYKGSGQEIASVDTRGLTLKPISLATLRWYSLAGLTSETGMSVTSSFNSGGGAGIALGENESQPDSDQWLSREGESHP